MSPYVAQRQRERDAVPHHANGRAGAWLLVTRDPFVGHVVTKCKEFAGRRPGDAVHWFAQWATSLRIHQGRRCGIFRTFRRIFQMTWMMAAVSAGFCPPPCPCSRLSRVRGLLREC